LGCDDCDDYDVDCVILFLDQCDDNCFDGYDRYDGWNNTEWYMWVVGFVCIVVVVVEYILDCIVG